MTLFSKLLVAFVLLSVVQFTTVRAVPRRFFKRAIKWQPCPIDPPVPPTLELTVDHEPIVAKQEETFTYTGQIDEEIKADGNVVVDVAYLDPDFVPISDVCTQDACEGQNCPIPANTKFTGKIQCDAPENLDTSADYVVVDVFDNNIGEFKACSYAALKDQSAKSAAAAAAAYFANRKGGNSLKSSH